MKAGLNVTVEKGANATIVRIEGRLDATFSPMLEKKIMEQILGGARNILLDFSQLNYLSSAGIRLLLSVTKKLKDLGGALYCCSLGEEVMEIIKMAGFEHIIHIFLTEQEAIQHF